MIEHVVFSFTIGIRKFEIGMMLDSDDPSDCDTRKDFDQLQVYSPDVSQIIARAVRAGDRVVDGGANVGFFTLLMAQLVGSTGMVYAVEPNQYNIKKIQENIKLSRYRENVTICPYPLWAAAARKSFYACDHNAWGSLHDMPQFGDAKTHRIDGVQTMSLDDIPGPLRLIKLDIEGAEVAALCGAARHIVNHQCPFIVCEINDFAHNTLQIDQHVIFGLMRAHGYDVFVLSHNKAPQLVPRGAYVFPLEGQPKIGIYNVLFSTIEDVAGLDP